MRDALLLLRDELTFSLPRTDSLQFKLPGYKGKGKVVPVFFLAEQHAMKAYWGSGVIAPIIL
jgi:hypothetical protein